MYVYSTYRIIYCTYCSTCTFYIHTCTCTVTVLQTYTVQTTICIQCIHVQLYSTTCCTCILYSDTVDAQYYVNVHMNTVLNLLLLTTLKIWYPSRWLPHGGDDGLLFVTH